MESTLGDTPVQNILPKAQFSDRFFAFVVDYLMINIPIRFITIVAAASFNTFVVAMLYMIIAPTINILYFAVYAYKNNGQTLGKKWNKVRVVDLQGGSISLRRFVFRELIAIGPFFIGFFFFGKFAYLWVLTYFRAMTKDKRALHDIIAKTQVISLR